MGAAVLTVFRVIRGLLFLVLYWLRGPVTMLCSFISTPMLFAFLFSWYAFPEKKQMWMAFGAMSFVSFALMWLYDVVLMALSPQDMVKTL